MSPALPVISGREAVKVFKKAGWQHVRTVGDHMMLTKSGIRANLSVPDHKELAAGTLRALIRTSGMTVDEFLRLV